MHEQGPCKPSKQDIVDQKDATFVVTYVLAMSGKYKIEVVVGSTVVGTYTVPCNQRKYPRGLFLVGPYCLSQGFY